VRRQRALLVAGAVVVALVAGGLALAGTVGSPGGDRVTAGGGRRGHSRAPYELPPGVVHPSPFARLLIRARFSSPPNTIDCEEVAAVACYSPHQLQVAYGLSPLLTAGEDGKGQTIAVVDCFGSPTIRSDLARFDASFRVPPPPSFRIVAPAGPPPRWDASQAGPMSSWGIETSLDVEYAHAMAPGARLVLLETPVNETEGTAGFPQIETAETWAIEHLDPAVITQSFGATEGTFPGPASIFKLRGAYELARRDHVTVLAATGDDGSTEPSNVAGTTLYSRRAIDWPASDPLVTAIGGTQLHLSLSGRRIEDDNVWNDTNLGGQPLAGAGGVSWIFLRPPFQSSDKSVVGRFRGTPDVSLSAALDGGAIVYASFPGLQPGYYVIGGTSEASPLFAGIVAIADQVAGRHLGWLNPDLYDVARDGPGAGIVDIRTGDNTVTFEQGGVAVTVPGYEAVPGYDLASGLGTVNADLLVAALRHLAR
jgi:subtilase family serine protease